MAFIPAMHPKAARWAALAVFLLLAAFVYLYLHVSPALPLLSSSSTTLSWSYSDKPRAFRGPFAAHRIAIVLPFIAAGPELIPPYLELFCMGAAGSMDTVDFLLIHNGVLTNWARKADCPSNVIWIDLQSTESFARLLIKTMDEIDDADLAFSRDNMILLLAKHLEQFPYALVEFKPALGYIFQEYLESYSHWGYSDLDMLFGDLSRWITPDELTEFDVVTYGFGDQHRLYARGQFTFHRNTPRVNTLWRKCEYLSRMDQRFAKILSEKKKFKFESAEGCYSVALLQHYDIRVKYAVKAWTDTQAKDTVYTHGVYLARSASSFRHVIYKAQSAAQGKVLGELGAGWFESHDYVYADRQRPLQRSTGERESLDLPNMKDVNCMYWVRGTYQSELCLQESAVSSSDTVYWINGQLFKQPYETEHLESKVSTAPFFHFQEWKRYYRVGQLATQHLSSEVSTFILTKEGSIPLYTQIMAQSSHRLASPLGLRPLDWKADIKSDRSQLPRSEYCLASVPKKYPSRAVCDLTVSWWDEARVKILSSAPGWKSVRIENDVTLTMTLQVTAAQAKAIHALADILEAVVENLERWQGQPIVLVIHVAGITENSLSLIRERFGPNSEMSFGLDNALVAVILQQEEDHISRKTLLNMAIDAAPTRWYISGLELERGLTLSPDAITFAHQAAQAYSRFRGNVFWVPQFALKGGLKSDLSLVQLLEAKRKRLVRDPAEFDDSCSDGTNLKSPGIIWWVETQMLLDPSKRWKDQDYISKQAASLQELEDGILELTSDEHANTLYRFDESPILLTDNFGSLEVMHTHEVAKEAEVFGGRRCYNALRIAQLAALGYRFGVLAGALAVSTEASRKAFTFGSDGHPPGASRCDGCFFFEGKHDEIVKSLLKEEIGRPVKASIVWAEAMGQRN